MAVRIKTKHLKNILIWNLSFYSYVLNNIAESRRNSLYTISVVFILMYGAPPQCIFFSSVVKVRGSRDEVSWDQDLRIGTKERAVHNVAAEPTGYLSRNELCYNWGIDGGALLPSSAPILLLYHPGE